MITLSFKNAVVKDEGLGLRVNGKSLEEIISITLGTKVGDKLAYSSSNNLSEFESTCCDITVIIDPKPVTTTIETNTMDFGSLEEMEEFMREQLEEKTKQADAEE